MSQTERIRELAKKRGISLNFICKTMGVHPSYFGDIEKTNRTIKAERLSEIAKILLTTSEYLNGETDNPNPTGIYDLDADLVPIPLVATVAAGYEQIADLDVLETVAVPRAYLRGYSPSECYMITIKGESMQPDFKEGDKVLFHAQTSVDSGAIAVIQYDSEEFTLKRVIYKRGEDWLELVPSNPYYPTKRITGADLEHCRVVGLVIYLIREIF